MVYILLSQKMDKTGFDLLKRRKKLASFFSVLALNKLRKHSHWYRLQTFLKICDFRVAVKKVRFWNWEPKKNLAQHGEC